MRGSRAGAALLLVALALPAARADGQAVAPPDTATVAAAPAPGAGEGAGPGGPLISPTRAVLVTPLFPGWGQLYARSAWRAALAWGATGFYGANLLMNDRRAVRWQDRVRSLPEGAQRDLGAAGVAELRERVRDYAWWQGGALLIIALDAYVGAHLFGFDEDAVPVPDRWDEAADAAPAAVRPPGPDGVVLLQWRTRF